MSNQDPDEKIFLVEISYDRKYVMDLPTLIKHLEAINSVTNAYKRDYSSGNQYEFNEVDTEISIRILSRKRLNELKLEGTLKGNTP